MHMAHKVFSFTVLLLILLGARKCEFEIKRPSNYFDSCPNCLKHPIYIDCPACRFTMDVR